MHSHHAGHLQVIYSAYPSVQLAVTPGMYPQQSTCSVGEGKPDDNSRSVVGVTDDLAWCAPRFLALTTTATPEPTPLLNAPLRLSGLSVLCLLSYCPCHPPAKSGTMREASLSAYGTLIPPCSVVRGHIPSLELILPG